MCARNGDHGYRSLSNVSYLDLEVGARVFGGGHEDPSIGGARLLHVGIARGAFHRENRFRVQLCIILVNSQLAKSVMYSP